MPAVAEKPMARSKRNDVAVKIEAEIVRKARVVVAFDGTTIAEYLSALLRPLVDRDYQDRVVKANKPKR